MNIDGMPRHQRTARPRSVEGDINAAKIITQGDARRHLPTVGQRRLLKAWPKTYPQRILDWSAPAGKSEHYSETARKSLKPMNLCGTSG